MEQKRKRFPFARELILLWVVGLAGQLCWNLENAWFNTFVYDSIGPYPSIVNWMVAISAAVTTFSTFFFGTISDRLGKRKIFIWIGYIFWGILTFVFGLTGLLEESAAPLWLIATMVVLADAVMSFFGSMGNDSGFNAWTADILNQENKGAIGAALAIQPVVGTIVGTVVGGIIITSLGYLAFFAIMGGIVALIGLCALIFLKDSPTLVANKTGTFWRQFASAFDFKSFFKRRELMLVNIVAAIFFIGFNVYFVHIGNLFIYNYGFKEADAGLIQGAGLIIAIIFTIPAGFAINKNKSPLLMLIALLTTIVGLIFLGFFAGGSDASNVFVAANIPLLLGVIIIGTGYVLFMQTAMVWTKSLFPVGRVGQFEGVRIVFFVLLPMIFGPLISDPLINFFGKDATIIVAGVAKAGKAPTEILFFAGSVIIATALIPLYYLAKEFKQRIQSVTELPIKDEEKE